VAGEAEAGDSSASRALRKRYISQLIVLAREKLAEAPRRMADEEDAVVAAFNSFCEVSK